MGLGKQSEPILLARTVNRSASIFLVWLLSTACLYAQTRTIQTVGGFAAYVVEEGWCGPNVIVNVSALDREAFVRDRADFSKLASGVRFNIELECPDVVEITLAGSVNGKPVYDAKMVKSDRWVLRKDTSREERAKSILENSKTGLLSFNPENFEDILLIEESYQSEISSLKGLGFAEYLSELQSLLVQRSEDLLRDPERLQKFKEELLVGDTSRDALDQLNELGLTLGQYAVRFPAITNYVELVQISMGRVIQDHVNVTLEAISSAGNTINDIASLFLEGEQEVAWLNSWDASDLANAVEIKIQERVNDIAETGYSAFVKDLGLVSASKDGIAGIEQKLNFIGAYRDRCKALERYESAAIQRINALRYEISRDLFESVGLESETLRTSFSLGGHIVNFSEFVDKLKSNGHEIAAASSGPVFKSSAHRVLDVLGWSTPSIGLSSISLVTAERKKITFEMSELATASTYFVPDRILFEDESEDLLESEWVSLMFSMGILQASGATDRDGVCDSDRFASDPFDAQRITGYGIENEDLHLELAIQASLVAIEENPTEPRYYFHLGRALVLSGEDDQAKDFLVTAAEDGYGAAAYYLAEILARPALEMEGDSEVSLSTLRAAIAYYKHAVEKNYSVAKEQLQNAEETFAIYAPPFDGKTFKWPDLLKAIYDGDLSRFDEFSSEDHFKMKGYILGLRSIAEQRNRPFKNSATNKKIYDYAPEGMKNAEKNLMNMLNFFIRPNQYDMQEIEAVAQYAVVGNADAETLIIYLESEQSEVMRFFNIALGYLDKFHK